MIDDRIIPEVPKGLIEGGIEGYNYFLNPIGHHGVIVLFGEGLEVFNRCRAGLSLAEMRMVLPWAKNNPQRVDRILDALGKLELVTLGKDYSKRLRDERQRATKKVMTVWLQLTDACNLHCDYCCISKKLTRMGLDVAKKLVEKVVTDSDRAGFEEVLVKIAGGEPTLFWMDAKALINWAEIRFANSNPKVRFHVITNGTLITQSLISYVSQGKVGISVSLDGVGKWNDVQRPYVSGHGSFKKVDENISKLLAAGIHFNILAVITKKNTGGLTDLAKYSLERGLDFRFGFYRDVPKLPNESVNDNDELIQELKSCYAWMSKNLPEKNLGSIHKFADARLTGPKIRNCGIGSNSITVTSDGKASICHYEITEPLGSILEKDSVRLITEQVKYDLEAATVDKIPVCSDCKWKYICGGGCPLLTERHYGTMRHFSPYCNVYKAILPVLVELHALQLVRKFEKEKNSKRLA